MRFRSLLPPLLMVAGCLWAQEAPQPKPAVVCTYDLEAILQLWVEQAQSAGLQARLELRGGNGDEAQRALLEGKSQLVAMNREMKPEEVAAFRVKWGYVPTRMAIAEDAVVVLVQKNNPLKSLKIEQLDAMYTTTRYAGWTKDIATWGDLGILGNNWVNRPILCLDHPVGTGMRDYFQQNVTRGGLHKASNKLSSDSMTMVEDLLSNQSAISYGSIQEVYNNLRTVAIVPIGGKDPVDPSFKTIANGEYPLTRVIYFYFNRAPGKPLDPTVHAYLRYVFSAPGQKMLAPMGLVPLPQDVLLMNKKRLES
ncbi:MAG: substrate-binding domain-containing protein [Holophaga sp.]|nr:substrate-binding domain-containing protein [Holophaga sp.]